jgi:Holliday junction resolvase RusA-like endonuclease
MDQEKAAIGPVIKKIGHYVINGLPVAQVRHSISIRNGKPKAFYKSKKFKDGKNLALNSIRLQHWSNSDNIFVPKDIPVSLKILYSFPRPLRLKKNNSEPGFIPHTKKPDIDNLDKLYIDALAEVVLNDDNQVYALESKKVYCSYDSITKAEGWHGIQIQVFCIDNEQTKKLINQYQP